ncbi:TetR/AcrR family transcriptional regulator [Flavihumibacter profundi]|uniref:TetR/AcrR family transcriptional regulator n=1 Tax=Flavihumibacter profundi TaxID=2716883 RepID=UPI001CC6506E|nr:TetR/AcrR family transcriptional regulator [Flavihumibacter profundi]MBZ5855482.1 TetR/AcrR family transcriptional regulator [Flavihumibacter profundi]
MKSKGQKRSYISTNRSKLVAQNDQNILEATVALWKDLSISEISLEKIAELSGVTVRTILRKFGSKEGLFQACIEQESGNMMKTRDQTPAGDIPKILEDLFAEYEETGDAVIRTLVVENEMAIARELLATGRSYHKTWCARVFKDFLPGPRAKDHPIKLMAFVAATDVYLWKLLRRDLKLSYPQAQAVIQNLLEGLIQKKTKTK